MSGNIEIITRFERRHPGLTLGPAPRRADVDGASLSRSDQAMQAVKDQNQRSQHAFDLLRRLGFPLGQIASALDDPQWQLQAAVHQHLDHTRNAGTGIKSSSGVTSLCPQQCLTSDRETGV